MTRILSGRRPFQLLCSSSYHTQNTRTTVSRSNEFLHFSSSFLLLYFNSVEQRGSSTPLSLRAPSSSFDHFLLFFDLLCPTKASFSLRARLCVCVCVLLRSRDAFFQHRTSTFRWKDEIVEREKKEEKSVHRIISTNTFYDLIENVRRKQYVKTVLIDGISNEMSESISRILLIDDEQRRRPKFASSFEKDNVR